MHLHPRISPITVLAALLTSLLVANATDRPNVIILLIDDLGRTDLGVDGSTFYETPRIDSLSNAGARFTSFYASHPVCSPTRAALMSGKAPQRMGITDWISPNSGIALPDSETTIAEAFLAHGYQTAYLGKWHLGETDADLPTQHGFEWTFGVNRAGQPASYFFPYRQSNDSSSVWDVPDLETGKPGDYLTDALTTAAIQFLRTRDSRRPFFLCFGHYAVHTPIQPPPNQLPAKYTAKRAQLYGDSPTPTRPAPFGATSRARQDDVAYAAMIENLDHNVGRLLDALADLRLLDNTIVVFTSDNGGLSTLGNNNPGPTSTLPSRSGKGWTYEGGIRIPTFITWPARIRPSVITMPAITTDLFPTLLDLCSLPARPAQHLDGHSLARILNGQPDPALAQRPLAWFYPHDHGSGHRASAALRLDGWKLIHFFGTNRDELYHLPADPSEQHNQAQLTPDRTRAMREQLIQWIESTGH